MGYLGDAELTLTEIAFLLGFSDASSFSRAFRRWFETTPSIARAGLTPARVDRGFTERL